MLKHRKTHIIIVWAWVLWPSNSIRDKPFYGLGMDALASKCNWSMDDTMVFAWMIWSSDSIKDERYFGLGMDALASAHARKTSVSGSGMDALVIDLTSLKDERYYGLGMGALATVCLRITRKIACFRHG